MDTRVNEVSEKDAAVAAAAKVTESVQAKSTNNLSDPFRLSPYRLETHSQNSIEWKMLKRNEL